MLIFSSSGIAETHFYIGLQQPLRQFHPLLLIQPLSFASQIALVAANLSVAALTDASYSACAAAIAALASACNFARSSALALASAATFAASASASALALASAAALLSITVGVLVFTTGSKLKSLI